MNSKKHNRAGAKRLKLGLRVKIISIMALFILVMAGSLVFFFTYQQKKILVADTEKWGVSLALNLAYDSEYGVLVKDKLILSQLIDNIFKEKDIIYVEIFDEQGLEIADFHQSQAHITPTPHQFPQADKDWLGQNGYVSLIESGVLKIAVPVETYKERQLDAELLMEEGVETQFQAGILDGEVVGYIRMEISLKETMANLARTRNLGILIISLVSIIFGLLLSRFLNALVINPIRVFAYGAEVIAAGSYNQQIDISTTDEIGQLAQAFNKMVRNINKSHQEIKSKAAELEQANRQLKETQHQLIQAGKLSAIGQLAAGVAHELNNPLGGILGYSQFILEKTDKKGIQHLTPQDFQTYLTYIGYIEKESNRCKTIVQNLLSFSRASKTEFVPLDINQALEETFIFTQHQLYIHRIELIKQLQPNLPQIIGNKHQLQQVFTNMIINAQQATTEGGKLTVTTSQDSAPQGRNWLEVCFADTGCGIPPEYMDKLFDPFFTTKEVEKGTGLGLSVSYGIIKGHSGDILVESKPGYGSTFIIRLPVTSSHKDDGK